jgi:HEAT repeat protein
MSSREEIRRRLQDENEETRHSAVQSLAPLGAEALPLLAEALGDRSWRVRKASLEAVVAIPGKETMDILLGGLRDEESAGRRNTCMEALIRLGDEAVPFIPALLKDDDADVRKFGVDILGNIESVKVLSPLMTALDDREDNVAAAAAEYLGKKKHREAVPALVARAGSGNFWVKFSCLKALGEIGDPAAAPAVLEMAGEQDLRKVSLEALGLMGVPEVEPFILEGLFSRDRGLRKVAILAAARLRRHVKERGGSFRSIRQSIGSNSTDELVTYLTALLRHDDAELRGAAMIVLGAAAGKEAVAPLLEVLPGAMEDEQSLIIEALADLPDEDLPGLFPRLRDEQPTVRRSVARVLGVKACKGAVPHLVGLLEDEEGHVRSEASMALGETGDQLAVAPLVSLLSDPYPDVRQAGVEALTKLGRSDEELRRLVLSFLDSQLESQDQDVVANALRIVARLGGRKVMERLKFSLKDERSQVRRAAVEALGTVDSPEALDVLRLALTDEDATVRREAVQRVGRSRRPEILPILLPMLQDEDLWVRVRAIQAVADQASPEAHEVLLRTVGLESAGPVKLAAIRALGEAKSPGAVDLFLSLADSGDRETRMASIEALGKTQGEAAVEKLVQSLGEEDWGLRSAAVRALRPFADRENVRSALEAVAREDTDPMVRKTASDLLGGELV